MSENTMAETLDTQAEATSADAAAQVEQAATAVSEEVAAALEGRAAFYETLAGLFWMPLTAEQVEAMAGQDFSAYAELNEDFADGVNDITRYLRKRNTGTRDEMAVDFTGTFTGIKTYEGKTAVPYKSVFTSEDLPAVRGRTRRRRAALRRKGVRCRPRLRASHGAGILQPLPGGMCRAQGTRREVRRA